MKKILILLLTVLSILSIAIVGITCNSADNGGSSYNIESLMDKTPLDFRRGFFTDLEILRGDDDLKDVLEDAEEDIKLELDWQGIQVGIDVNDVNSYAMYQHMDGTCTLLDGNFNLSDIKDGLDDSGFNADDYNGVEIWEDGDIWVALIGDLIIIGDDDDVKDCIDVIGDGEESMLDDNDCKDIMDKLPGGFTVFYSKDVDYSGFLATGYSLQKKDKDTLNTVVVYKFQDKNAAESTMDVIEGDLADEDFYNIEVDQDGELVIVNAEVDIDDFYK